MREHINKTIRWCLTLLILPLIASCQAGDETRPTNDYCYIKSATLGMVKRITYKRNVQGTVIDETSTSYSASDFVLTINQLSNTIENHDSLPYGSQLSKVLVNIAFDGQMILYREKGSEGGWSAYASTDSMNLEKPLELFVQANDGGSNRTYTLKVNVHKQEGDSLYWHKTEENMLQATNITDIKAFTFNHQLKALYQDGTSVFLAERSSLDAEGSWQEQPATGLPSETDLHTLCKCNGMLYISTTDGHIYSSSDAANWSQVSAINATGLALIGVSSALATEKNDSVLYALSNGQILYSKDAATWQQDKIDAAADKLPVSCTRALRVTQKNGNERILMLGNNATNDSVRIWNKMWNAYEPEIGSAENPEAGAEWMYIPSSKDNKSPCPVLDEFCMIAYDGECYAFGGKSLNGNDYKAFENMWSSPDYGITWRISTSLHLPFPLIGSTENITATVDDNNFIWIITNTQVWRGRLNRLGFARQ